MTPHRFVGDVLASLCAVGPAPTNASLVEIVERSAEFMSWLHVVRDLRLESWCIGAGAVRNLVWDSLQGSPSVSALSDVDVAYFDSNHLSVEHDERLLDQLRAKRADVPWEVTNQAGVHLWFEQYFGHAVEPLHSLEDAVSTWPEYATCVGVTLREDDTIGVIAPHGLDDLFSMTVRRNPVRVSVETYRARCDTKNYAVRWPRVKIVPV